jgi:PEP-CTERM motif
MKFLTLAAFLLLGATADASPCLPGTLQDYVNLDPTGGCTVNNVLFQAFELAPILPGATEIDPNTVQMTPNATRLGPTLLLTLNTSANAGEVRESFFRFNAIAGNLQGGSIALGNALAAGDGAVTGILDVCAAGFFLGIEPIGCSGTPGTAIAFATAFDASLRESLSFAPTSFFDVFVDLTVDGGLAGFASLDTAAVTIPTPEPSTMLLFTAGLFTLCLSRVRPRRRSMIDLGGRIECETLKGSWQRF